MPVLISQIADIVGILSFILSIVLLIKSEALRKSIIHQRMSYNKEHSRTRSKMMAFSDALQEDDSISPRLVSEMRQELFQCLLSYHHVLSFKDRRAIKVIIGLLSHSSVDSFDKTRICKQLDYLIARFYKKEDS